MGKNWEFSKQQGRKQRLNAELAAHNKLAHDTEPPLFSHCGTMQYYFERAWHNVSQCDINLHLNQHLVPSGTDRQSKLRSLRTCHSL